jgi:hypothetical protein
MNVLENVFVIKFDYLKYLDLRLNKGFFRSLNSTISGLSVVSPRPLSRR